LGSGKEIHPRL